MFEQNFVNIPEVEKNSKVLPRRISEFEKILEISLNYKKKSEIMPQNFVTQKISELKKKKLLR